MATKRDKIKALRFARERIKNSQNTFLCFALKEVGEHNPHLVQAVYDLRRYVEYGHLAINWRSQ